MKLQLTLLTLSLFVLTGCGGEAGEDRKDFPTDTLENNDNHVSPDPTTTISDSNAFNDYAVHDPSVIKTNGSYYVFGSHLAAAKTDNLMTWEGVSSISDLSLVDESPLFDYNYTGEAAEGIAWSDGFTGSWAADVIQAPNGKYWFYYNHCAQDNPDTPDVVDEVCWNRSYMGLASSDNIEGPYVNEGVFLRSGYRSAAEFEQYPVRDLTAWDGAIHPNAIDPAAFYDKEGNLWMVYGSYSGGIFILAMDEETGLPEPDQGYGTHLVGGNGNAMEGSFVVYSPESDYYYLFWSNGGFEAEDGYNIRVARSRTPAGPYLDSAGNDMTAARVDNNMGTKLMGGFNFNSELGDTSTEWGYRSPGHNSALYDAELGEHLLFTHTRFPAEQAPFLEANAIRVHQMWVNDAGWLVASPYRYAPVSGDNNVDVKDLEGDYKLVRLGVDTNLIEKQSVYVSLNQSGGIFDGVISGAVDGSYSLNENQIHVTVDGVTYSGVAQWQWNTEDEVLTPIIAAMSPAGETLWAVRLDDKSESELASDILAAVHMPETLSLSTLALPVVGARNTEIHWSASDPMLVRVPRTIEAGVSSVAATVVRPALGSGDQTVTLTAAVYLDGEQVSSASYDMTIPARVENNFIAQYSFENNLMESLNNLDDAFPIGDRPYNTGVIDYAEGVSGQALSLNGTNGIRFPSDLITNYEYTVSYWLNPTVLNNFTPSFFGAVDEYENTDPETGVTTSAADRWVNFLPANWDGNAHFWSHNVIPDVADTWFDGTTGITLSAGEWVHVAFAVNQGNVDVFLDGVRVGGTANLPDYYSNRDDDAVFTMGVNYWDIPLNGLVDEFKIYDAALSAEEIKALDINGNVASLEEKLEIARNQLDLGDLSGVTTDLSLTNSGAFAAAIDWVSSNESVISPLGYVTRPGRDSDNAQVTLTATITLEGQAVTKEFVALVIADGPPQPVARFSFENDLVDATGNFAAGTPVGPGITDTDDTMVYDAEGAVGSAISFAGGSSAGAKLANNLITDHSYAFAFWLKPNSLSQFTTSFFGWAASSSWISVVPFGPGAGNTMLWSGEAWFDGDSLSQIPTGEWTHLVFSVNEGDLTIWLNGQEANTFTGFPDVFSSARPAQFAIGTNLFAQDASFDGLMDELVIFGEPITQAEVDTLFAERE